MSNSSSKIEFYNQSAIVDYYYESLYGGDLKSVKEIMTKRSYFMMLDSFGLRLSMRDSDFKRQLENKENSKSALKDVEKRLSYELLSRNKTPKIDILKIDANGIERKTIKYKEDGKVKKLYFSKEYSGWKINYFAGRPVASVPKNYLYSIKKWANEKVQSFRPNKLKFTTL